MRAQRVLNLAAFLAASVGLASCGSTNHSSPPPSAPSRLGRPLTVIGPDGAALTVTVTSVASQWAGTLPTGSTGQYSVSFRIANAGHAPWSGVPNDDVEVIDSAGRIHTRTPGQIMGTPGGHVTLAPGSSGPGADTFTLSAGRTIRLVEFALPGGSTATWSIN